MAETKMSPSDKAALAAVVVAAIGGAFMVKGKRARGFRRGVRRAAIAGYRKVRSYRRARRARRSYRRAF